MNTLQEIKKANIKKKVMYQIKKAKQEILVTMDIAEEKYSPLPVEYFLLLEKKMKEGIKIKRVLFGPKSECTSFIIGMKKLSSSFTGKYTKSKNYKRMILIDQEVLYIKNSQDEKYYVTHNEKIIKSYLIYFNKFLD